LGDNTAAEVYRYNANGTYSSLSLDTAGSGNGNPVGITWDGTHFWVTDTADDEVYKYEGTPGTWPPWPSVPTVSTAAASNVAGTAATLNGSISDDGGASITQHGFAWGTSAVLGAGTATTTLGAGSEGAFDENVSSLSPNTTYYFRAYAVNSAGTSTGSSPYLHAFNAASPIARRTLSPLAFSFSRHSCDDKLMFLHWLSFAAATIATYVGISLFAQLAGANSTSALQAFLSGLRPLPLIVLVIANMFFGLAVYLGFALTRYSIPMTITGGVIVSAAYSVLFLGAGVSLWKLAGIALAIAAVALLSVSSFLARRLSLPCYTNSVCPPHSRVLSARRRCCARGACCCYSSAQPRFCSRCRKKPKPQLHLMRLARVQRAQAVRILLTAVLPFPGPILPPAPIACSSSV
jgi:hypothetical protein